MQEKPEERVALVAMDTGLAPASLSSAAATMEIQLPATDRLEFQYFVQNFMREITRATCVTLARA